MKNEKTVYYDPEIHAGLLTYNRTDIIIADAQLAKMHELPLTIRKVLAESTRCDLALLDFSGNIGTQVIEPVDPERVKIRMEGYKKGLRLLQLPEDQETA